jgi:hypothetical protein
MRLIGMSLSKGVEWISRDEAGADLFAGKLCPYQATLYNGVHSERPGIEIS